MWFKSKIEHPDPEIRRKHVEQLEADDAALIEVARDDPHPDVRSAAVARIVDLPVLQELVSADGDQRVREIASARLHEVIAGNGDSSPALESRLAFLDSSADDRLMRFVARSAQEPALRKVAINRLLAQTDKASIQDLLCDIAADDPVQEIRQAAAQPIQDKDRLQKLLERSRGRDKSVHRLARDRLEQIQVHWAAREGLEECCGDAEQLAVEHHFSADGKAEAARLARVTGQWDLHAAAADQIEQQLTSRYQAARDGIESKLAAIRI
ncbi:MAG: hypothetical protein OEQ74_11150, partial [Gammaproteobacteria bacterium]|nr:hypothetical protein [Gammaproteobacteria bacterium]